MNIFFGWLISATAIMIVGKYVPGIHIASFWTALVVAVVLGIFNVVLRPILIILTLPVTILSLGLFLLIINAGIFFFASTIIKGFTVDSFGAALVGSILLWLINWGVSVITKPIKKVV